MYYFLGLKKVVMVGCFNTLFLYLFNKKFSTLPRYRSMFSEPSVAVSACLNVDIDCTVLAIDGSGGMYSSSSSLGSSGSSFTVA